MLIQKRFEVKNTYCRIKKEADKENWGQGHTGVDLSAESGVRSYVAMHATETCMVARGLGHTFGSELLQPQQIGKQSQSS